MSYLIGSGYENPWDPFGNGGFPPPTVGGGTGGTTVPVYKTIWVPPTQYVPGTPNVPPTPSEIIFSRKRGWNSWARSVSQLSKGSFFEFTCPQGTDGIFIGLGPDTKLGSSIGIYKHSLIIDVGGIRVYELSNLIKLMTTSYSYLTNIKIFYQDDDSIVYVLTTGSETLTYESTIPYVDSEAYIFAYIYSSEDKVLSADYKSGTVQYGSV